MNKIALYGAFKNIQSNFIVSYAALYLFDNSSTLSLLDDFVLTFNDGPRSFTNVFEKPRDLEHAIKEFMRGATRAVVSETWELVNDYTKNSETHKLLKSQPWYHFIRLIRNALSHNYKFVFKSFDRDLLPIYWNGKTISGEMEGMEIQTDVIGYDGIWDYLNELDTFITEIL